MDAPFKARGHIDLEAELAARSLVVQAGLALEALLHQSVGSCIGALHLRRLWDDRQLKHRLLLAVDANKVVSRQVFDAILSCFEDNLIQ